MTPTEQRAKLERVAQQFHETYERLAPQFGYETRKESAVPWEQVPERNRQLMVAVCKEVLASYAREGQIAEHARTCIEFEYDYAKRRNRSCGFGWSCPRRAELEKG